MSIYNEVNRVLIGKGTNTAAITTVTGIAKGDLFLLDEKGTPILTNAAAAALSRHEKVHIATGVGPGLAVLSSPIQGNTVSKFAGKAFVAPADRVVILGYNGSAGTGIAVVGGKEYRLRVRLKDNNFVSGQRPSLADVNYPVPIGGTVQGALQSISTLYDASDYGKSTLSGLVKLERVSNGTRAALSGTAMVVTNSKVVTLTAHALIVGSIIRLDTVAQTTASPVYVVSKVISANSFELDVAYKGISGTIVAANSGVLTASTEWGLKLSGIPVTELLPGYDDYSWINFEGVFSSVDSSDFTSIAKNTEVKALNIGQGYWKQVREIENKAKAYLGQTANRNFYDKKITSQVVEDTQYSSVTITHTALTAGDFQDTMTSPLKTNIYFPAGSAQGLSTGDNFVHVLNGFFGTKVGFTLLGSL